MLNYIIYQSIVTIDETFVGFFIYGVIKMFSLGTELVIKISSERLRGRSAYLQQNRNVLHRNCRETKGGSYCPSNES